MPDTHKKLKDLERRRALLAEVEKQMAETQNNELVTLAYNSKIKRKYYTAIIDRLTRILSKYTTNMELLNDIELLVRQSDSFYIKQMLSLDEVQLEGILLKKWIEVGRENSALFSLRLLNWKEP